MQSCICVTLVLILFVLSGFCIYRQILCMFFLDNKENILSIFRKTM
ncbi:hypothetical protein HMPREF1548_02889 [Clostridium sp. KLE 1755]|nr:hypothetical protein HMPREF1548_02889 [Clostridium sp. KLE 1755]